MLWLQVKWCLPSIDINIFYEQIVRVKYDFISVIFLNYQTVGHSSLDDTSTKIQRPFELDVLRSDLVVVGLTCRV